jgi:predicted transcriptional regulator of viral defense system
MTLERVLRNYPHPYVTDSELENLLDGTANSRYSKVKRMVAQGKLLHIRRGLYCITNEIGHIKKPHPYELAQYIYGPSFVSLESALSYHHLIPEAVYTTTSVTGKRSKEFKTPLGIFSYRRVPLENLYTEVLLIKENEYKFYMAKPWRAICDYLYCYRQDWNSLDPFIKSLRINLENLPDLHLEEIQLLDEYYHQSRMSQFLKRIQKEWNPLEK